MPIESDAGQARPTPFSPRHLSPERAHDLGIRLERLFAGAGCHGRLCVQSVDGAQEYALRADGPVVAASVFKVPVALAAESAFATGSLDPRTRVLLRGGDRVSGPVGISLFSDDVQASLRDLCVAMLTISDNVATDAVLAAVGIEAVNALTARLGLVGTVVESDLATLIDSIGQEAGFGGWNEMSAWFDRPRSSEDTERVLAAIRGCSALDAPRTNRTTARESATLLRLIWNDQAGPAAACARVRWMMARQLTKNRLASGFAPPARVAAKSGGLIQRVRNEIGVVRFPDGRGYSLAVFTRTGLDGRDGADAAVNAAIGAAAAMAVDVLRQDLG